MFFYKFFIIFLKIFLNIYYNYLKLIDGVKKMSLGSRMRELREYRKISRKALAKELGITEGSIGHYETDFSSPSMDLVVKISNILGCDLNYLFQDDIEVEPITFTTSKKEQEILKKLRAINSSNRKAIELQIDFYYKNKLKFNEEVNDRVLEIPELASRAYPKNYKLYTLVGNSMAPLFEDGDVLIVTPTEILNEGDIGLFKYKDRIIIRKYLIDRLEASNPENETINLTKKYNAEILGKVDGKI